MDIDKITLNEGQQEIFDYILSGKGHVCITGGAGRGKSVLVRKLKRALGARLIVLATTGKAAVEVNGMTAHSALSIPRGFPTPLALKRVTPKTSGIFKAKNLEYILIDESSFLRSDELFSVLDRLKRYGKKRGKRPARNFKLIFVGDFTQLSAVMKGGEESRMIYESFGSPVVFKSNLWSSLDIKTFQLQKNERTADPITQKWLEKIRFGEDVKRALKYFNDHCYRPIPADEEGLIVLTTTNASVAKKNRDAFLANDNGSRSYTAKVKNVFNDNMSPCDPELHLKVGLRVMTVINDSEGDFINGSVGTVTAFYDDAVEVKFSNGVSRVVKPHKWENTEYYTNEDEELDTRVIGTFTQIPLKQADAQTCHKAQGATLDAGIIDLSSNWVTHGIVYVLLSRFRNLDRLFFTQPIKAEEVICNRDVREFYGLSADPKIDITFKKCADACNALFVKKSDSYVQDLRASYKQDKDAWLDLIWSHNVTITHNLCDDDLLTLRQTLWKICQVEDLIYMERW